MTIFEAASNGSLFFMRSIFVFITFVFTVCQTAYSQTGFGPEAGMGMSSMHFAPAEGFTAASGNAILSGKIGAVADLSLNKHYYLQAGVSFSRKGQTRDFSFYTNDSLNEAVHQTLTINYFDVPVTLLYKTGSQGKGRIFLGMGVTPSYILGGRNRFQSDGVDSGHAFHVDNNTKIAAGNPLSLFDIGLNLSAGYELPTGLYFRMYYTVGVRDIGLGGEVDKNRMWGISAGYFFGKGRNINKDTNELIDKTTD